MAPREVALDSAGDVFIVDTTNNRVVELPKTSTGYGQQTTLPFSGLNGPAGVALDSEGDVFIADAGNGRVLELPKTATGYGTQTTLPASGLSYYPTGVAVDSAGDVFIADAAHDRVVELLRTATGYGPQKTLSTFEDPDSALVPHGVAVDGGGDVFVAGNNAQADDPSSAGQVMEIQTRSVNFGDAYLCASGQTTPAPCSVTLPLNFNFNAGATLGTPKVLTGGAPGLDFTLAEVYNLTADTISVNVTFSPTATGVRNGSVEIVDGSGNVLATATIYGFGLAAVTGSPVAEVSTNLLQFDTVAYGSASTLPLMVTNIGGGTLIVAPSINGQSYIITGSTCTAGVTNGNNCTLQVEFSPVIVGAHDDLLTVLTNGPANFTVKLEGIASGVGSAIRVLNFGTIPAYTTAVRFLIITNVGVPGTVTIGTAINGNSFTVLNTAANICVAGIAAGQSCTLPVEFLANSVGDHNEQLTLTPSGGAAASVVHLDAVEAAP